MSLYILMCVSVCFVVDEVCVELFFFFLGGGGRGWWVEWKVVLE